METTPVLISWSGGKDSSLALYKLQRESKHSAVALLATLTEPYNRISMHGVSAQLLRRQTEKIGLPLTEVYIKANPSNYEYEQEMQKAFQAYLDKGISKVCYGDIFLEDIRNYREKQLQRVGMQGIFPLWQQDSRTLAARFIQLGFKAVITCIDSAALPRHFAGRSFDAQFIADLPAEVDPCGENGEFHSFVYDGPIFKNPVDYQKGKVVLRDERFYFCDLFAP